MLTSPSWAAVANVWQEPLRPRSGRTVGMTASAMRWKTGVAQGQYNLKLRTPGALDR